METLRTSAEVSHRQFQVIKILKICYLSVHGYLSYPEVYPFALRILLQCQINVYIPVYDNLYSHAFQTSAIMTASNPGVHAFMADEVMESIPGFKLAYTLQAYVHFQEALANRAQKLKQGEK